MTSKSYFELSQYKTFEERFRYLKLNGVVGDLTFNGHRYLNQLLYKCPEWQSIRRKVIIRDNGFDLGVEDCPISGKILVHHINPITVEDVLNRNRIIFDLDNLITVSHETHNAIHYGNDAILSKHTIIERREYDTCPWRE